MSNGAHREGTPALPAAVQEELRAKPVGLSMAQRERQDVSVNNNGNGQNGERAGSQQSRPPSETRDASDNNVPEQKKSPQRAPEEVRGQSQQEQDAQKHKDYLTGHMSSEERAEYAKRVLGERRDPSELTRRVLNDSLKREFLAIHELLQENPTAVKDWQNTFYNHIKASNRSVQWDSAGERDITNALDQFFRVRFSGQNFDAKERRAWYITGLQVLKRQMAAEQLATGARNEVKWEGQKVSYPGSTETASSIGQGEDIPVEELNDTFSLKDRLRVASEIVTGKRWRSKDKEFRYKHTIRREKKAEKKALRKEGKKKPPLNQFEVNKQNHFTPDATTTIVLPGQQQLTLKLDAVQKRTLEMMQGTGTLADGATIGELDGQIRDELNALSKAYRETVGFLSGRQLVTQQELDLLSTESLQHRADPNRSFNTGIREMRTASFGLEGGFEALDKSMEGLMSFVARDTERAIQAVRVDKGAGAMVDGTLGTLDERITQKAQLTPEQQQEKTRLEGEVQRITREKQPFDRYTSLKEELEQVDQQLEEQKIYREKAQAEQELRAVEQQMSPQTEELSRVQREKQFAENELKRLEGTDQQKGEITRMQEQHIADMGKIDEWKEKLVRNSARLSQVTDDTERQQLAAENAGLRSRIQQFETYDQRLAAKRAEAQQRRQELAQLQQEERNVNQQLDQMQGQNPSLREQTRAAETKLADINESIRQYEEGNAGGNRLRQLEQRRDQIEADMQQMTDRYLQQATQRAQNAGQALTPEQAVEEAQQLIRQRRDELARELQQAATDLEDIQPRANSEDEHQKRVLEAFNRHFRTSAKIDGMRNRAGRMVLFTSGHQPNPEEAGIFFEAADRMPEAMPAYVRFIQIAGSNEALAPTKAGQRLFDEVSSVVTPEIFITTFLNNQDRVEKLARAIGETPDTLRRLGKRMVYDPRLRTDEAQQAIFAGFQEAFVDDLINQVYTLARTPHSEDGAVVRLGRIPKEEAELIEGAHRAREALRIQWKNNPGDANEPPLNDEQLNTRLEAEFDRQKAGLDREVTNTERSYFQAASRRVNQGIWQGQLAVTTSAERSRAADPLLGGEVALTVHDYPAVVDTVYRLTLEHKLRHIPGPQHLLENGQKTELYRAFDRIAQENGLPPITNVQQVIELIRGVSVGDGGAIYEVSPADDLGNSPAEHSSIINQAETTYKVIGAMFEAGASQREALLTHLLLTTVDSRTVQVFDTTILGGIRASGREFTVDNLVAQAPKNERAYLQFIADELRSYARADVARARGEAVANVSFDDITEEELKTHMGHIVAHRRGFDRQVNQPIPQEIQDEIMSIERYWNALMERENLNREVRDDDRLFFDLKGDKLAAAIALRLGGDQYRRQAIILVRQVEKRRAERKNV